MARKYWPGSWVIQLVDLHGIQEGQRVAFGARGAVMGKPDLLVTRFLASQRWYTLVRAGTEQATSVGGIPQIGRQRHIAEMRTENRVFDGDEYLNSVIQVPLHEVSAAYQDFFLFDPAVGE